ncbi:MAG: hypothetical protein ABWW65_07530 [Thermoprotei archaeon]
MSNSREAVEKLRKLPVRETRLYYLVGYVLRALPYLNIVGSLLTGIGWAMNYKKLRKTGYLVAFIGSLVIFVTVVVSLLLAKPLETASFPQATNMTFIEYRDRVLESIDSVERELRNPITYTPSIVMGFAVILEAFGVGELSRDTRKLVPAILRTLFIVIGVLLVVEGILHPLLAGSVSSIREAVMRAETVSGVNSAVIELLSILTPLVAVSAIGFILGLIVYIYFGYKYWKLQDSIRELLVLSTSEESSAELI